MRENDCTDSNGLSATSRHFPRIKIVAYKRPQNIGSVDHSWALPALITESGRLYDFGFKSWVFLETIHKDEDHYLVLHYTMWNKFALKGPFGSKEECQR